MLFLRKHLAISSYSVVSPSKPYSMSSFWLGITHLNGLIRFLCLASSGYTVLKLASTELKAKFTNSFSAIPSSKQIYIAWASLQEKGSLNSATFEGWEIIILYANPR